MELELQTRRKAVAGWEAACAAELNTGTNKWHNWACSRNGPAVAGKAGRLYKRVRPTRESLVVMAVATRHNPWALAPYITPHLPRPTRTKWENNRNETCKTKNPPENNKTIPRSVPSRYSQIKYFVDVT